MKTTLCLVVEYNEMNPVVTGARGVEGELEYPPHPARVFQALVSAAYQAFRVEGANSLEPQVRAALEWLEAVGHPNSLYAPQTIFPVKGTERYVPSATLKQQALVRGKTHDMRPRFQPKAMLPQDDRQIIYLWEVSETPEGVLDLLNEIASNVTYLGTADSVVTAWFQTTTLDLRRPNMFVAVNGRGGNSSLMRVPYQGYLRDLDATMGSPGFRHVAHRAVVSYRRGTPSVEGFETMTFKFGLKVPLAAGFDMMQTVRRALLAAVPDPVPGIISGHAHGDPYKGRPVSLKLLAEVGFEHSSGNAVGFEVFIPPGATTTDCTLLRDAFSRIPYINYRGFQIPVFRVERSDEPAASFDYSSRKSKVWTTIVPFSPWRSVKNRSANSIRSIEGQVFSAFEELGIRVDRVETSTGTAFVAGAPPVKEYLDYYMRETAHYNYSKQLYHVKVTLGEPLAGPLPPIGSGGTKALGNFVPFFGGTHASRQ